MHPRALRLYACLLAASFFAVPLLLAAPVAAQPAERAPGLFSSSQALGTLPLASDSWIVRQRPVAVDFSQLAPAGDPAAATSLHLNLFDDVDLSAALDRVVYNPSGSISWVGHLPGGSPGSVILVYTGDVLVGSVRTGKAFYQLVHRGAGAHAVYEIDEAAMPEEWAPTEVTLDPEKVAAAAQAVAGDSGAVYDLMVVYTATARANAGGTAAMEAWIDLGVTETNMSYTVSGVNTQINLVYTQEVTYNESGSLQLDRDRLRIKTDGFLDEVHGLRDDHAADVVTLIVESPGCGISHIMNPVSTAFEEFAFNVTMRACVSPNYTFGHEIGHIQSARHDRFVDPTNNAPYSYNHGYVDPQNRWRSIMAYSNACGGCQRQLFWSNPDRNHPVTGNPTGVPDGQADAADNHMTLNSTAFTVANFRQGAVEIFTDGFESGNTSAWSSAIGN